MIKKLIIAFGLLPVLAFAQTPNFKIQGRIEHLQVPAKVYLTYRNNTDSATITDGAFIFKGKIDEPEKVELKLNLGGAANGQSNSTSFYIEQGTTVFVSDRSLNINKISGTRISSDFLRYTKAIESNDQKYTSLYKKYGFTQDDQELPASLARKKDSIDRMDSHEQSIITANFIRENSTSFLSLKLLPELIYELNYADYEPLFHHLSVPIQNSIAGKQFALKLELLKSVAIGNIAPDFEQPDSAGRQVRLSSYRGKYVLIDFWGSWCIPCRRENLNICSVYSRYKGKNFEIIGVAIDWNKSSWIKAIQQDKLTWVEVSDLKGGRNMAAKLYGANTFPQNFLIDPNGKIVARNLFGDDLDKTLAKLL